MAIVYGLTDHFQVSLLVLLFHMIGVIKKIGIETI